MSIEGVALYTTMVLFASILFSLRTVVWDLICFPFLSKAARYKSTKCFSIRQIWDQCLLNTHWWHMSFYFLVGFWPISQFCFRRLFLLFGSDLQPPFRKLLSCLCPRLLEGSELLWALACALGTADDLIGLKSWFFNNNSFVFSVVKSTEINSEYFVKFVYLYCCCRMMLEVWKVENVFSSISASETLTLHNSNWVTISNNDELYLDTKLKSCSLICCQAY